jgi:hypothetical protein
MAETQIVYERADLTADELRSELRVFFDQASDDAQVRKDALDADVDLDEQLAKGSDQIEVEAGDAGFTGFEEAIFLMLLQEGADRLWDDVVQPWLKRRHNRPIGKQAPVDSNEQP